MDIQTLLTRPSTLKLGFGIGLLLLALNASAQQLTTTGLIHPLPGPEIVRETVDLEYNGLVCILKETGDVFCWGGGSSISAVQSTYESLNTALNNDIAEISLSDTFLCGIGKEAGVACIYHEHNNFVPGTGQSSGLDFPPEPDAVYIALSTISRDRNVCAIQADNRTVCWGENSAVNNVSAEAQYLKQLDIHESYACGVDLNDELVCWGEPVINSRTGIDSLFGGTDPASIGVIRQVELHFAGACTLDFASALNCYGFNAELNDLYNAQSFESIIGHHYGSTALCYETTDGDKDCVVPDGSSTDRSFISTFPVDAEPMFMVLGSGNCYISNDYNLLCGGGPNNSFNFLSRFPSAPENLSVEVYSDNALELFWTTTRSVLAVSKNKFATGYEIYRDGQLIDVIPLVSSYFDADADLNALYEVRALRGAVGGDSAGVLPNSTIPTNSAAPVEPDTPSTSRDDTSTLLAPEVNGQVYSSSAIELIWNRVDEPGVTYNIYRNGELLRSQTPATSHYDSNLNAGTTYTYDVQIGRDGNVYALTTIELTTLADDAGSVSSDVSVEPVQSLHPENESANNVAIVLSGQVYSSSAVEIFWNRASDPSVTYNIYRNGVVIREQSPATSQFDPELVAGSTYLYSVEAMLNGNLIGSATTELTTFY